MRRALWAVPVLVFAATFGVFGLRHPGSVRAMVTNPSGVLMMAAAVFAAGIFVWAARFRPRIQPVVPLVIALGIGGAAVYAEVPFERSSTQNKIIVRGPIAEASIADRSNEEPTAPIAQRRASADLRGINHTASGQVSVIEAVNGDWVVRFEDFAIQGVPAPVLYAVPGRDADSPGGASLGAFTATDGARLDVALPRGIRPVAGWTVLIWCDKFDTPVANATFR